GSHPEVSLAELRIVFGTKETAHLSTVALFDIDARDADDKFSLLGSIPRYGVVLETLPKDNDFKEKLAGLLIKELNDLPKKEYVITLLGVHIDKKGIHHSVKELLPKAKYDGSFGELQHTPATVHHVISRGGNEFVVTPYQSGYLVIKTEQVQDPRYWSIVDVE